MSTASTQRTTAPPPKAGSQAVTDNVELSNVQNGSAEPSLPLEEDIMQCARIGALEHIQKMIESGRYRANHTDPENITPLHWSAINNQYAVCKYLLDHGADVNAKGGESNATAAMWAAQRCHFYIVNLMIQYGVDLLLVDAQGYNILHLATIDGNAFLVVLLLLQNIPVDAPDPQGHTSLMWAGYKGWPACVDLLLKWGASVNAADDNGFTPLHWALVKGSRPCLEKLIEYGADRFAKTNDGKTPAECSQEMNSRGPYIRALQDQGYTSDGQPKQLPLNLSTFARDRSKISKFLYLFPFLIMIICAWIISHFSIFIGLPLSVAVGVALQWGAQWIGQQGPSDFHAIHKTPYLAGIFSGTLFYIGFDWLWLILPLTYSNYFFSNLFFAVLYGLTAYFYFLAMTEDPGYIPKLSSRNQQRDVVQELFNLWKFDEENFCIQCMIRRPLRSKHCRRCGRCVAKHDHHCPWINSCVANNNIRHFYLYIVSMWFGIIFYMQLVLGYLEALPAPADSTCNLLPPYLCTFALRDTWTITLSIWTLMQMVWISMLMVVQSIQIAKNITTYENMKRHDHTSPHGPSHLPLHNARPTTLGASPGSASLNDTAAAATRIHPATRAPDSMFTKLKKTLGIDVFFATASDASAGKIKDRGNPFSRGVIGNCKDFWCDPAPIFKRRAAGQSYLGGDVIDYYTMYDRPSILRSRGGGGMRYERVATEEGED
ncbi:palmitoyltransferase akr1 [Knufia obscura]|uniref:Palmitoyltransferase n=2 Tax=Knufia TaxID=430999 RepID=A0AAN8I2B8_9EURO|nr:palmitoyltransferase akr1 [Knufia obscura]KAK5950987.1 palmitoyltransferase akr1 [Knufia fluminis]